MGSVCKDRDKTQRENNFHTRCMVMGKIRSLIIDEGSCIDVTSQILIEKLALKISPHPRPYKLQWLSENGKLVVDRQVLICFSIGKYVDEILFDVVPMEPSNLLRGRPRVKGSFQSKLFYQSLVCYISSISPMNNQRSYIPHDHAPSMKNVLPLCFISILTNTPH